MRTKGKHMESGGMAPPILNLYSRWTCNVSFTTLPLYPHPLGSCLVPRANLNSMEQRKIYYPCRGQNCEQSGGTYLSFLTSWVTIIIQYSWKTFFKSEKVKALLYPVSPDFRKKHCFFNSPRLCAFVLVVSSAYSWRRHATLMGLYRQGKTTYSKKTLPQCYFFHLKSHIYQPGTQPRLPLLRGQRFTALIAKNLSSYLTEDSRHHHYKEQVANVV